MSVYCKMPARLPKTEEVPKIPTEEELYELFDVRSKELVNRLLKGASESEISSLNESSVCGTQSSEESSETDPSEISSHSETSSFLNSDSIFTNGSEVDKDVGEAKNWNEENLDRLYAALYILDNRLNDFEMAVDEESNANYDGDDEDEDIFRPLNTSTPLEDSNNNSALINSKEYNGRRHSF